MASPEEILAAPVTLWVHTAGTAEPDIDDNTLTGWTKIGTSGDCNYSEDGVTVTHEQELATFTGLGKTGAQKAWRTNESFMVELEMHDLSVEQYAKILNDASVTTTAAGSGVAGKKDMDLLQGYDVSLLAVLIRASDSPYGEDWNAQFWIPRAYQAENPAPVFKKGEPAGLALSFMALQDATDGFGKYAAQNADPT